jgi:nitronate monooxygenase
VALVCPAWLRSSASTSACRRELSRACPGAKIISSATTGDEARWLEGHGCDAIIAQGYEAGGHRGVFLTKDISTQAGTIALVLQVVDAVRVPVIAAGGIGDARGIVAALALGASAAQIGTAYLFCPEAKVSPLHHDSLKRAKDNDTVLTNVFTGRRAGSSTASFGRSARCRSWHLNFR